MKQHFSIPRFLCTILLAAFLASCANAQNNAQPVSLVKEGVAQKPIIISNKASEKTKELAQTLADYLGKISGAEFTIKSTPKVLSLQTPGIAIGLSTQFADFNDLFNLADPTKTEDYLLQTYANGVSIVGATELGLRHAVWDLLFRLGYRQFFPGKDWEIIPHKKDITISISTFQSPDYYSRRIWPGYGALNSNDPDWADWNVRNRMGAGISLSTGHAYGKIIRDHKAEFEKHPEYLSNPDSSKFCVSNPGLQKLVINDVLSRLEKNPDIESISMEPSDGGGWECGPACADANVYKRISDRAVTLANVVAEAVNEKFPHKFVGLYAYNQHSPPPIIEVNSHVIPSIATGFIRGGSTLEQLLDGWDAKSKWLGIREYYSVYAWDKDLPGHAKGSNLNYLKSTIPHFYEKGARFMTAESSDNWGPNGLGYYIASRLLWDTDNAKNVAAIRADFLEKAFGAAKEPMDKFYDLINGSNNPLFSEDLVGRMYRQLDAALQRTDDPAIRARINDLVLYTRYTELYRQMNHVDKKEHLAAFVDVLRFAWRIRESQMVHTLAIWRALDRYERVKIPKENTYRVPIEKNPWKSDEPFTPQQIQQIINEGIANNKLRDFEIKTYSKDLVKADALHLTVPPKQPTRTKFSYMRGTNDLLIWLDEPVTIKARAGINYTNRGNTKLTLHQYGQAIAENDAADAPIAPPALQSFEVPPDKAWHEYTLKAPRPGIYVLRSADKRMGSDVQWPQTTPVTIYSTLNDSWTSRARAAMYFYVPEGTTTVGGFASGSYHIYGADGKVLLSNQDGFFNIPVPEGQDGKLWEFGFASGNITLLTVPSYLTRSPQELMLPREVVEKDVKE